MGKKGIFYFCCCSGCCTLKALWLCLQMDSQLACMMSESSVDYIARFNDLAQELAVTEPSIPPP